MKVQITKQFKQICTVDKMPFVKQIIAELKEDNEMDFYAQIAARVASGKNVTFQILKFSAEIAKNCRVNNAYGEGTADLDVWLNIYAFNHHAGFYDIGIYLTDVWNISGENQQEIKNQMYIWAFTDNQKEE